MDSSTNERDGHTHDRPGFTPYHERDWTDAQIERHVPAHIAENFDGVAAAQYDGDYSKLAGQLQRDAEVDGQHGTAVLAAWARKKAAEGSVAANTGDVAPAGRGRKPKQTA